MSIEQNAHIVKDSFASIGSYNKQDLLALVAEDIEWIIPGENWPLAGTHRGHAEPRTWITSTLSELAPDPYPVFHPPSVFALSATQASAVSMVADLASLAAR